MPSMFPFNEPFFEKLMTFQYLISYLSLFPKAFVRVISLT
jgi:hypothetical protein